MLDQAEALRILVRDRMPSRRGGNILGGNYTIAVTSGKGGVGKTSLAVNLALLLGRSNRRVRLVDADLGLSNADVMLGVAPHYTMSDILNGHVDPCDAWMCVGNGVKLLSSGSGLEDMANMDTVSGIRLMHHVYESIDEDDVIIADTAPGISDQMMAILEMSSEVLLVTTPEPTSITDSYALMKVLISRKPDADITLVVNCASSPSQAVSVAEGLAGICDRFLGRSFNRYEYLPADAALGWSVRTQKPLVTSGHGSMLTPWLKKIAIKIDDRIRKYDVRLPEADMVGV